MGQPQVLEGTWEEIKLHDAELIGRQVKVIIKAVEISGAEAIQMNGHNRKIAKQLRGRGMLAGVLNTKEFLRNKHEGTIQEDKSLR